MEKNDVYLVVDELASEYSWTIEYILNIPTDVILMLHKQIVTRKKLNQAVIAKLTGIATACAFNGKLDKLDKLFEDSVDRTEEEPEIQKEQMRKMWISMNRDPKEFEAQYKNGEVRF